MVKYAICYVYCSNGAATAHSQTVWVTESPLAWVTDLEDAKVWDDEPTAKVFLDKAKSLIHDGTQVLNVVAVNWYEECEENDE